MQALLVAVLFASAAALWNAPSFPRPSVIPSFAPSTFPASDAAARPVCPGPQQLLFVSPTGSDTGSGTRTQPFRTLQRARDAIRAMLCIPSGGVQVNIAAGTYDPLVLEEVDSGAPTSAIAYAGAPGAVVSAGAAIPPSAWVPVALAHTNAVVYRVDLLKLGITDYGRMIQGSLGDCQHDKLELFYGGNPMVLARYPNVFPNGSNAYLAAVGAADSTSMVMNLTENRPERWISEEDPWLHGYFAFDWFDFYAPLFGIAINPPSNATLLMNTTINAHDGSRFYAVNMLTELDHPGEYYVTSSGILLFITPDGQPPRADAIVSVNDRALLATNVSYVTLSGLSFFHSRLDGGLVTMAANVTIQGCNFSLNGANGLVFSGVDSLLAANEIGYVGCGAMRVTSGDTLALKSGNTVVADNFLHHYARWKRCYMPGIHWVGVGLLVSGNYISHAPHNGILGGANEGGGNLCTFEYNTIDSVCQDTSDAGAFYTCGQAGQGWISRGNVVRHNTFLHIRNVDGGDPGELAVNGIYLDDQTSGYEIYNNSFIDCNTGVMMGGGRDNHVHHNYFAASDLAVHLDDRGAGWQASSAKFPNGDLWQGVARIMPFQDPWASVFPKLWNLSYCGVPVFNVVRGNTYCNCSRFQDFGSEAKDWLSTLQDNFEGCRVDGAEGL